MSSKRIQDFVHTIREFRLEDIPLSQSWIICGVPESGKSVLVDNLCYFHKHRYPVARIWSANEGATQAFAKKFPPIYISNYYDADEVKRAIQRQRLCIQEQTPNPYSINVFDDVVDDPSILKSKEIRALFRFGSQHYRAMTLFATQYALEFTPDVRNSASYVAMFRENNKIELEKLWKNFGGIVGTLQDFTELMNQVCGDYTCLIIKRRSQSNKLEDNVFFYKTHHHDSDKHYPENWKFGCKEYLEWNEKRYNTNYVDPNEM